MHYQSPGYDGQFYAQLAVEPLLRNRRLDKALDTPPYRARRILFSWTAYVLGLGRPRWILKAYALQNIIAWLLLAWLLLRWFPPSAPRNAVAVVRVPVRRRADHLGAVRAPRRPGDAAHRARRGRGGTGKAVAGRRA